MNRCRMSPARPAPIAFRRPGGKSGLGRAAVVGNRLLVEGSGSSVSPRSYCCCSSPMGSVSAAAGLWCEGKHVVSQSRQTWNCAMVPRQKR
jgi:hypothetical protein